MQVCICVQKLCTSLNTRVIFVERTTTFPNAMYLTRPKDLKLLTVLISYEKGLKDSFKSGILLK